MQCGTQNLNYQKANIWLSISNFTKYMLETFRVLISSNVAVYEYWHYKPFISLSTRRVWDQILINLDCKILLRILHELILSGVFHSFIKEIIFFLSSIKTYLLSYGLHSMKNLTDWVSSNY